MRPLPGVGGPACHSSGPPEMREVEAVSAQPRLPNPQFVDDGSGLKVLELFAREIKGCQDWNDSLQGALILILGSYWASVFKSPTKSVGIAFENWLEL